MKYYFHIDHCVGFPTTLMIFRFDLLIYYQRMGTPVLTKRNQENKIYDVNDAEECFYI